MDISLLTTYLPRLFRTVGASNFFFGPYRECLWVRHCVCVDTGHSVRALVLIPINFDLFIGVNFIFLKEEEKMLFSWYVRIS